MEIPARLVPKDPKKHAPCFGMLTDETDASSYGLAVFVYVRPDGSEVSFNVGDLKGAWWLRVAPEHRARVEEQPAWKSLLEGR